MFKPKPVEPLKPVVEIAHFPDMPPPPEGQDQPRLHPQQQYIHVFNPADWRASKRPSKK